MIKNLARSLFVALFVEMVLYALLCACVTVSGKSTKKDDNSHEPASAKPSDTKKFASDDEDFEIAM